MCVGQRLQKLLITLVTYTNENARLLVSLAFLVDVDSNYFRQRTKIPLPHLKRPPFEHSDFEESERFVSVPLEVFFVNGKVVDPFVDDLPVVSKKILPKIHSKYSPTVSR